MSSDPETGIKPDKNIFKAYSAWVKKNTFTMIAIIIILGLVWFELATVEMQKVEVSKKCNAFWYQQIEKVCPALIKAEPNFSFNLSDT